MKKYFQCLFLNSFFLMKVIHSHVNKYYAIKLRGIPWIILLHSYSHPTFQRQNLIGFSVLTCVEVYFYRSRNYFRACFLTSIPVSIYLFSQNMREFVSSSLLAPSTILYLHYFSYYYNFNEIKL